LPLARHDLLRCCGAPVIRASGLRYQGPDQDLILSNSHINAAQVPKAVQCHSGAAQQRQRAGEFNY